MMVKFILQIIIMLSLGVVLYLISRALPRINDEEVKKTSSGEPHWFMLYLEKTDVWLKAVSEKSLRRARVWILKLDNFVGQMLNRFKKEAPKETGFPIEKAVSENKENGVSENT